jgi:cytochrome c
MNFTVRTFSVLILFISGCAHQPADSPSRQAQEAVTRGKNAIEHYGCPTCHTIPGIRGANGLVGPSLDRIASRTYIAGVLQNTHTNMLKWIQDPPSIDNKTAMPKLQVSDTEARDIAAYLYTLK